MKGSISTRERILTEGLDLLSTAGFAGVTLGVLADRTGMSKSGLYAHFGSKEEVQLSLLDKLGEIAAEEVVSPAMLVSQGLPRLKAVVANWLGWYRKAGLRGGCPVAAGVFELDDLEGPVRDRLTAGENEWDAFLTNLVQQAKDTKDFRRDLDVSQFVWELKGIYLSHHASNRFSRDPRADRRADLAFARLLKDAAASLGTSRRLTGLPKV